MNENAKILVVDDDENIRKVEVAILEDKGYIVEAVGTMVAEKWPVVFAKGTGLTTISTNPNQQWPVVVGGEYLVFANPNLVTAQPDKP